MPQSPAAMHASHMFAWQLLERLERLADDAHLTRATRSDNAEALTIRQCCETFDTRLQVESVRISQYSGGRIRSTKHARALTISLQVQAHVLQTAAAA